MAKFIGSVKEQALKYAQIGKPKSLAEINRRIYTGLDPDWEPIMLAQSKRMLTMSADELQSFLVGHEERRLYAATQNLPIPTPAPLSRILGSAPEIHYTSGRINRGGCGNGGGKGNDKGGKGKGKGGGSHGGRNFSGEGSHKEGNVYPNQVLGRQGEVVGSDEQKFQSFGQVVHSGLGQVHTGSDSRPAPSCWALFKQAQLWSPRPNSF
ncbi:hypothetical protein CRG98_029653 [Punica granatum]|uniref:Uncharacterized protein n=1 Tax=Punica granatum TaxID=22663 RepID=A0A2I0J163_PUNGR|nr:hypothetical protein CRG98_029653 [Punica granatum]